MRKRADQPRRPVDLDRSLVHRLGQGDAAQPDVVERRDVRGHEEVNVEPGMIATHRGLPGLKNEPGEGPSPPAVEIELHNDPVAGELIEVNPPVHPPQQQGWIELLRPRVAQRPLGSPPPQGPDSPLEFFSPVRQTIFAAAIIRDAPLEHAELPESFKTSLQQGARNSWKAAHQLVEVAAAAQELADDQDCPTVTQNLRSPRDGTILIVSFHALIIAASRGRCPVAFLYWVTLPPARQWP